MDRTDLDIPESTVWPASDEAPQAPVASQERLAEEEAEQAGSDSSGEQSPTLDPNADDGADRAPKL